MSKFSKILAVLMSVCLLFGATTAFLATATEGDPFNVTNRTGNSYQAAWDMKPDLNNNKPYVYNYVGGSTKPKYNPEREIASLSGVTLDFDVNPTAIAENQDGKPVKITPRYAAYTDANADRAFKGLTPFYIHYNDGAPYLATTTGATSGAPLLSGDGIYSHITIVLFKNSSGKFEQKVFVNGDYSALELAPNAPAKGTTLHMVAGFEVNSLYVSTDDFLKNIAYNHYAADDNTLDPYKVTTPTASIYDADKVVFNADYAIPDAGYVSVDGKKTYIPELIPKVLATVENGSVVEATVDVLDFDVPDEVDNFTLIYDSENTEFTLSEEDKSRLVKLENPDGSYTVRSLSESDKMQLKNIVKYGDKELVVKSGAFVFLMQPEVYASFTVFDLDSLTLYEVENITGWKIDVDGKVPDSINLYGEEDLRALSVLEAELIKEEFDGILTTYATAENGSVKETKGYAYIAGYLNDGVFTPIEDSDGGYENYKDIATLEAEKATWDSDVVCYEIVDGKATLHEGSAAQGASAIWNSSSNQLTGTTDTAVSAGVTNIVKNSFKDNGTVDGYGILIIR